jgi:hypothetical protein
MKELLKKILGAKTLGRLDYFLKPSLRDGLSGVFNGQKFRQRIYSEILASLPINAIVETGSYLGTTTAHFAASGLPVYSVESNPRFFAYASMRFRRHRSRVHLFEGDTLQFLRQLKADPALQSARVFFYLDAHWYTHLPLREELEIVFGHWKNAVVMVDDFQVPGTDYRYDDYGPGKALTMEYLEPLAPLKMAAFFPAVGPEGETGLKRGCVVLARDEKTIGSLKSIASLRAA